MDAVTIPVMAKARIGHFVEAQVLEALGVDYIDESEVLTPADESNHIDKHAFKVPFVCGCRNLGEALRRINEGAAMMRTKGEAGTGNIVEAVRQLRDVLSRDPPARRRCARTSCSSRPRSCRRPYELVKQVAADGKLPVVNFVAGGISTPADAALVMQLGAEGVFVGSGIFKSEDPARMANAIVQATTLLRRRQEDRRGLQGPGRPDARHRPRGDPGPGAARRPRLVGRRARQPRATATDEDRRPRPAGRVPRAPRHARAPSASRAFACASRPTSTGVSGLILPGGESTTMRQLIERWGLREPILDLAERGAPIFGTCAGMIVLAREIAGGEPPILPLLDVTVERNAFGRQLDSFEADLAGRRSSATRRSTPSSSGPRSSSGPAPTSTSWPGSTTAGSSPSGERNVIATAFHPELAGETRFHRLVATMAAEHDDPGEGSGRRPHPTRRARQPR